MLSKLCHKDTCRCAEGECSGPRRVAGPRLPWGRERPKRAAPGDRVYPCVGGALNRKWVLDRVPLPPPTHPSENCFMHQPDEEITLDGRLDKACEPGVDYGEWGSRREARKRRTHACSGVSGSVKAGVVLAVCGHRGCACVCGEGL